MHPDGDQPSWSPLNGQSYHTTSEPTRLPYSTRPALSPFHETPLESTESLNTRYKAPGSLHRQDSDPFRSKEDIPLQTQYPKGADNQAYVIDPTTLEGQDNTARPQPDGDAAKKGFAKFFTRRTPWLVYTLSAIQIIVFIAELVRQGTLTGIPIEIKPSFNPMIGPSPFVLINMGARYLPCMRTQDGVQNNKIQINWPCPTSTTAEGHCTLSQLCGMGGVPNPTAGGNLNTGPGNPGPNQWWRFITPMFMHGGIIHITANMLLQLVLGRDMECVIGPVRFFLVYFSSGIFGFVMGGNFAASGIASTGCSGALFGIIALVFLDLLYTWTERRHPGVDLLFLGIIVLLSFAIGLLPAGTDNFSHIGGFLMGLVLGVCILHSPSALRKHIANAPDKYTRFDGNGRPLPAAEDSMIYGTRGASATAAFKHPIDFFKDRKLGWWIWWAIRAAALVGVLVSFIVLLNNFYKYRNQCTWCKYLSCLPVHNWCDAGNLDFQNDAAPSSSTMPASSTTPTHTAMLR